MKSKVILAAVFAALALPAAAQVTVKYDEFKKVTLVKLENEHRHGNGVTFGLMALKEAVAQEPEGESISLRFVSQSDDWEYLDCHHVAALADGEPVELPDSRHDGSVGEGYVLEFIYVDVGLSTLKKLAAAKEVKFKVCTTVITLTPEKQAQVVEFLSKLTGNTTPSPLQTPPTTSLAPTQPAQVEGGQDTGRVTGIDGVNVYISLGTKDGTKVGDKLTVFADERIKNPLGVFTVTKGLGEHLSSGTFDGNKIEVGAWVRK